MTIVNAGTITGGRANGGASSQTQADAITLTGGTNRLTTNAAGSYSGAISIANTGTLILDQTNAAGGAAAVTYSNVFTGAGALSVNTTNDRAITLSGANTYTGGTTLNVGTLDLNAATSVTGGTITSGAAGTGDISFGTGAGTLRVEQAALSGSGTSFSLAYDLSGFSTDGDGIVLTNLRASTTATATYNGGTLTVTDGTNTDTLTINTAPAGSSYNVVNDGNGNALVTLVRVEPTYTIAVDQPATGPEGTAAGSGSAFTYTVTRTGDTSQAGAVAVGFTGSADGSDYGVTGLSNGAVSFAAGDSQATFTVTSTPDAVFEADETVIATLGAVTGGGSAASGAQGSATTTITNDDAQPSLSVSDVSLAEGDNGTTAYTFTVSLSAANSQTVEFSYATANDTAQSGSDYTRGTGRLRFDPGQTTQQITVQVTGDTVVEPDERFFLELSDVTNATIADGRGVGTIVNDDAAPPNPPTPTGPTPQADNLTGTNAADTISLLAGNDRYSGLGGNDLIYGNQGNDTLYGNEGSDTVYGGQNDDRIIGGQDSDRLYGNLDNDRLYGNDGNDRLYGGQGNDYLVGGDGADILTGGPGNDILIGGAGADRYVFTPDPGAVDLIRGFSTAEGDRLDLGGQDYTVRYANDGDAILTLSGGSQVRLDGVTQQEFTQGGFFVG